jgi:hypothetical protein
MEPAPLPEDYRGGQIKWTSQGLVVPLRTSEVHKLVFASSPSEDTPLAVIAMDEGRTLDLKSCGMRFSGMQPVFSPSLLWAANGATVAVARNPAYAVDIYEDGRLVRSVRRALPLIPASAALAEASLGDGMRVGTPNGERVCDSGEVVEQRGFAPHVPMIGRLAVAPDGSIWVERFDVTNDPKDVDLFDPDGSYLGTLPKGTPFPVGFLPDGRILVSETNEFDVEQLVIMSAGLQSSN